ncbi:MAG: hypothetical protein IT164_11330 [Bryobacterales bacterium]|nr:hypothetical protein [Bryobacterales bacterium]
MQELSIVKESSHPGTPLFLFECRINNNLTYRWATHEVTVDGETYEARVLEHGAIEYRAGAAEESGFAQRVTVRLANADHSLSALTIQQQWKGAEIIIRFVVFDLSGGVPACPTSVVMRGTVNPPDLSDCESVKISILNRMGSLRAHIPSRRIQRRCPWLFPRTAEERQLAAGNSAGSRYSPFYWCGYSADVPSGVGNLADDVPFETCGYSKTDCVERGMFDQDEAQRATRRFGGFQYVPTAQLVSGFGETRMEVSAAEGPERTIGRLVPIAYGTVWTDGIITAGWFDGNLGHLEVVLSEGPIAGVVKVVVNDIEVPVGSGRVNATATGWYNVVTVGGREGAFNGDSVAASGESMRDPGAGVAVLSVVLPRSIVSHISKARVKVLLQGLLLPIYTEEGEEAGASFTSNSAWVLLDLLRRAGYKAEDVDLGSFAKAAAVCDELMSVGDGNGGERLVPKSACNTLLRIKRPIGEVIRGVQLGSRIGFRFRQDGRMGAYIEDSIGRQQTEKPAGSNSTVTLNGGWPSYEFGDGQGGAGGIVLSAVRGPALRLYSRSYSETANRVQVEFVDPENDYATDTLSLVDIDDVVKVGQEIGYQVPAVGVTGYGQAYRLCKSVLDKNVRGNVYAELESGLKAALVQPGEVITLNVPSAGLVRQPFRVMSVAPGRNCERVKILAQVHSEDWYAYPSIKSERTKWGAGAEQSEPRPLLGDAPDGNGGLVHSVTEQILEMADGSHRLQVLLGYKAPAPPGLPLDRRPLVPPTAGIALANGSFSGPQVLYYAITEKDLQGRESSLSASIRAVIPAGTNSAQVTIQAIRMSPQSASMSVYRGNDPWQMHRIADGVSASESFIDVGLPYLPDGPPDLHFAMAVSEWRMEYLPPMAISSAENGSVTVASAVLEPGSLNGKVVRIHSGRGQGQERAISSNTDTTISITSHWAIIPDGSSSVCVVESGWQPGGRSAGSPCVLDVPNLTGSTIHLRVYGVNANEEQSRKDLARITRHVLDGVTGSDWDADVPPKPTFGLAVKAGGLVEVSGVSFASLENTATIAAGTLNLHFANELAMTPIATTVAQTSSATSEIVVDVPISLPDGVILAVGMELMRCTVSVVNDSVVVVERGVFGSGVAEHPPGTPILPLKRRTSTIPFPKQFFGSLGSGDFVFTVPMESTRLFAADLMFTNARGNSEVGAVNFTVLPDRGLRVLRGGQIVIQADGHLAIQSNIAPPIIVSESRSIRDVFATVEEAPVGAALDLRVRRNATVLCTLTIPAGAVISQVVPGANLGPLTSMDKIAVDITSVGVGEGKTSGRNLTVTIRL